MRKDTYPPIEIGEVPLGGVEAVTIAIGDVVVCVGGCILVPVEGARAPIKFSNDIFKAYKTTKEKLY